MGIVLGGDDGSGAWVLGIVGQHVLDRIGMKALAIPFRVANGAIATTIDYDDIVRWQVLDAAATGLGERVMRPQWGLNIRDYLMRPSHSLDQLDTAAVIKQKLIVEVERATVTDVGISVDEMQQNLVTIEIRYKASRFAGATNSTVAFNLNVTNTGEAPS